MKKLLLFILFLIFSACVIFAQDSIRNGESGASVRHKINYSFTRIDTLFDKIDTVYMVLPSIVSASDTISLKPHKKGNILITPNDIYISKDSIRGSWIKLN